MPDDNRCCPAGCCDMRGLLTFQILWELRKGNLSGQQIAERIERRRGTKPTPGTIYPALKEMKQKGLIEGTTIGREVVYALTERGRSGLTEAAKYFCRVFGDILDECRSFSSDSNGMVNPRGAGSCRTMM
ncbi:MAG: PadR family transcriptional regulator [Candidatus Thorarchaeota archaeon]|nr:PadR family transcriptional regulator [Candidatus Thorarchaeota archaeon]